VTAELPEKLLAELDHARRARGRDEMVAALRTVVERHAPTSVGSPEMPACSGCSRRSPYGGWISWVAFPCGELQAIARELWVDG